MKPMARPRLLLALSLASMLSPASLSSEEGLLFMDPPYLDSNADGFWRRLSPESCSLSERLLRAHLELCKATGADSQLVLCRGGIVSEWYSRSYRLPVYAMSSTKAISSLLVGILIDRGMIGSVRDRVSDYLDTWRPGPGSRITIEQILTHSSGYLGKTERGESVGFEADKTGFVLNLLPEARPGRLYSYSNEAVQLLKQATRPSRRNREMGYLWWILYLDGRAAGFYASGYLNTDIYVLPSKELVIVRTQAPKAGFTGEDESKGYAERARIIFGELLR